MLTLIATVVVAALVVGVLLILVCFPFHEYAHAYIATRLGDDTPRLMGRVTLNPIAHLDPVGSFSPTSNRARRAHAKQTIGHTIFLKIRTLSLP